jgi:hypothetical protein
MNLWGLGVALVVVGILLAIFGYYIGGAVLVAGIVCCVIAYLSGRGARV